MRNGLGSGGCDGDKDRVEMIQLRICVSVCAFVCLFVLFLFFVMSLYVCRNLRKKYEKDDDVATFWSRNYM